MDSMRIFCFEDLNMHSLEEKSCCCIETWLIWEKLAAIKIIQYRDLDYEAAKKEVAGYFQMKGEAYASDASTDLELGYELVCKIMDDLEREGKMEAVK